MDLDRQFIVFSVSRADLRDHLRFSTEHVTSLSDEEMQRIASAVREEYAPGEDAFTECVYFVTRLVLAEKGFSVRTE